MNIKYLGPSGGDFGRESGRFVAKWWTTHAPSEVPFSERFGDLDSALARGEQMWATGRTTKVAVLIDDKIVAWSQPTD